MVSYLTKLLGGIWKKGEAKIKITQKEYKSAIRTLESMFEDSLFSESDARYANYLRKRIATYNKNHTL